MVFIGWFSVYDVMIVKIIIVYRDGWNVCSYAVVEYSDRPQEV